MKKKYFFIGLILLLVALLGYHLYAASEAERQIDKTIQKQAAKSGSVSVQYSSIDVAPFSGKVSFDDLTVILGNHIQRAHKLVFNVGYLDFLSIYFGGLTYGLDHLNQARITIIQPSYLNQQSLREVKMDTLHVLYEGNALDAILATANESAFSSDHSIEVRGLKPVLRFPEAVVSKVIAESFNYLGIISEGKRSYWKGAVHQLYADSLIWKPSEPFQNTYRFFIRGFGYPTDAIPFQSLTFYSEPVSREDTLQINASLRSELAQISAKGFIDLNEPLRNSELQDMKILISELSASFKRVLQNIEQLLSISLTHTANGITLEVRGTLAKPRVTAELTTE